METSTIVILIIIGITAGMLSGFVGIGGGVIIVPALVYMLGMSQHGAQGTSLFLMLPPIGVLAVYNYYKAGSINIWYGVIIAICFIIGGYFGSRISLKMNPSWVKLIFGILMVYVAFRMIWSGLKEVYGK